MLRVIVRHAAAPVAEPLGRKSHDTGVYFVDRQLFGRRVLLLDDSGYLAVLLHNAAVPRGISELNSQNADTVSSGFAELRKRLSADQRHIAHKHESLLFRGIKL